MAADSGPLFKFVSTALDPDTFQVVRFTGVEGLSTLYRFEVLLVSPQDSLDLELVLASPATFSIQTDDSRQAAPYHGIIEQFQQLQKVDDQVVYRAVLVPKLWRLTQTRHNQIFLDQTPQEIIEACLQDGGLSPTDYEVRIQTPGRRWNYACQYNESHFQFFSHWAERYGYYYYFDQSGTAEKLIFTDTLMSHERLAQCPTLGFAPTSGLDAMTRQQVVRDFNLTLNPLAHKIKLTNYSSERPDLDLEAEAIISATGVGDIYTYGESFPTRDEGQRLAAIRAQEHLCRHQLFDAGSQVPFITPGYRFSLREHYRPDFNGDYLIIGVSHEGGQEGYLTSGLGTRLAGAGERPAYRNRFTCIAAEVQYRAPRETERQRIHGTLSAKVDAAGSGKYAELDAEGRYKVILPFDLSGKGQGKASAWLRKAGLYAGADHGIHFPLHKGTEVALAFHDGDPNRPYILAAIPNPSTPNVVNAQSQTQCRITTAGQNQLHFEDLEGQQSIHLSTPTGNSFLRLGFGGEAGGGGSGGDGSGDGSPGNTGNAAGSGANGASYEPHNTMYQANYVVRDTGKAAGRFMAAPPRTTPASGGCHGTRGRPAAQLQVIGAIASTAPAGALMSQSPYGVNQSSFFSQDGIVLNTDKRFSVKAGIQNSTILGENGAFVGGNDNKFVAGLRTDSTIGPRLNIQVGAVKNLSFSKLSLTTDQTRAAASTKKLNGTIDRLTAQLTDVEGEVNRINEIETCVTTAQQRITETQSEVSATATKIRSEINNLAVDVNQTYATKVQLTTSKQEIDASVTQVQAEVSQVSGDVTRLQATVADINTECSRVATEVAEVATNVSVISAVIEMM